MKVEMYLTRQNELVLVRAGTAFIIHTLDEAIALARSAPPVESTNVVPLRNRNYRSITEEISTLVGMADTPFTPRDICDLSERVGTRISLPQVVNSLSYLKRKGYIGTVGRKDNADQYELTEEGERVCG